MFSFLFNLFKKYTGVTEPVVESPEEEQQEEVLSFQERMIKRWAYKTIDRKIKSCTYRKEERDGIVFEFWTDSYGNDVKMLRNDGEGYIQICNQHGEVFGCVMINTDCEDTVCWVRTSEPFDVSMRWFMAYN